MTISNEYSTRADARHGRRGSVARLSYAPVWRVYDLLDALAAVLVPRSFQAAVPGLMILPAVLVIGLLAYGFLLVVEQSLHVLDTSTYLLRPDYSFDNYRTIFSRPVYGEVILRTILTGILVSVVAILLAFPFAYALVRTTGKRRKKLLLIIVFLPFLMGSVIRGYAWLLILGRSGIINSGLQALGLPTVPLIYNYTGVIIGLIQLNIPLAVMIIAPALTAISVQVEEAAQSLGAHWTRVFWTVTLPMALPGVGAAFVILFTLSFSEMVIPTMLGGGRADFIANAIYSSYIEAADVGVGAALCVLTTCTVLLTTAVVFAIRGLAARRAG